MQSIEITDLATDPIMVWAGRALSAVVLLYLVGDGAVVLFAPHLLAAEMAKAGFPDGTAPQLGVVILVSAILYAIPRTSVLGAILITGFLGGAICTHFRLGEVGSPPQLIALVLGLMTWGGLHLRDRRVRAILPLRLAAGGA